MDKDRDDLPQSGQEPQEHMVPPEEEPRMAYSDAAYRSAPREGPASYGYNPARYYAREEETGHRGQFGMRALLALCLLMVIASGALGVGSLYILSRDRRQDQADARSATADFYAEAVQEQDQAGPLALCGTNDAAPMSGEDIYVMACGQVVGVTAGNSAGSGIIVSADGYILTNQHVIAQAAAWGQPVTVAVFSGQKYDAQVLGAEADSDLAVLKIEAEGLTPAVLGNSDGLAVGETVYAVGNPMADLPYTMTRGVVSARDRLIATGENVSANMFQFDAPMNRGGSGGPVYNARGQVVGVATAKYAASGVEGLGFAIPSADACRIANELITKGYVSGKAYLGLVLDGTYTPAVARYYRQQPGAYIRSVQPGSAAETAGLLAGDIVTAVDGAVVADADSLVALIRGYKAGDTATLTVWRGGGTMDLSVTFGEAVPAETAQP